MLDAAGWEPGDGGIREKGGQRLSFNLYVRSESQENIAGRAARQGDGRRDRVEFKVQVVSVDKLTELTTQKVDGKMAPGLRHVHLGLGRRPVRPEHPARS